MPQGANKRIEQNARSYNDLRAHGRLLMRYNVRPTKGEVVLKRFADELVRLVDGAHDRLRALGEDDVDASRGDGAWTKRQILGHLVDSTAANHQRFVRAQFTDELRFPAYDAPGWVQVERYDIADWDVLVDLWVAYVRHLAHVLSVMPHEHLDTPCWVDWYGEPEPIPLHKVVSEYLDHVCHHLGQLIGAPAA